MRPSRSARGAILQSRIDATDRQIDRQAYELHGLTEESAVVEGPARILHDQR